MAEPGDADAVAFLYNAPFEVHKALLGRMSPKSVLRMGAVCKKWRYVCKDVWASYRHYIAQPRPLICFDRVACPGRYTLLRDYCVESLDIHSNKLRSVLRFTDNELNGFCDEFDLEGRSGDAPRIKDLRVNYARMERHGKALVKPELVVHGSLGGHLLVSSVSGWHVVNPVTRNWVALPASLSPFGDVVGFYEHFPSGEYRVLCFCAKTSPPVYGVLTVSTVEIREIGLPISSSPAAEDHGLASGVDVSYLSPPIQSRLNGRRLHRPPQARQGYHILVFDTVREVFSWKRPPPVRDQSMRLLEFSPGYLGLSVSGLNKPSLELWRLDDYHNEVWAPVYRIQLQLPQMPVLQEEGLWIAGAVSIDGDVLIETPHWVLHCDRYGNLLRQFRFPQRLIVVRHMLKESLLPHRMFREPKIEGATEPRFFHGLCSDPSF